MSKTKKKQKTIEELLKEALVPKEEQPYEVPGNWVWVRLGKIVNFVGGGTPSKSNPNYWNGEIPWASVKDFKNNYLEETKDTITKEGLTNSASKVANENELLLITRMSPGKSAITKIKTAINQDLKIVRPIFEIPPYLLWIYFTTRISLIESKSTGSTVKGIRVERLNELFFPLPPKDEQIRIANKVERLLNKIDEAKRLIQEAKETFELRRAAILDKAFRGELTAKWREENPEVESAEVLLEKIREERQNTKQKGIEAQLEELNGSYKLPSGWKWVRLLEILEVNPPKEKIDAPDDQICSFVPMAAVSDVTGEIIEIEERKFSDVKRGYTLFKDRDIIFAKITPCMENGKSAIVRGMKNGFAYGSTEFYVLRISKHINEELIYFLVRSRNFRAEAKRVMTGAVGQQRVPKKFIEDYLFPLPPKMEQKKIVSLINSLFKKEEEALRFISLEETLDTLKNSILSKAFRGELGTNDPAEESAFELLKEVLRGK